MANSTRIYEVLTMYPFARIIIRSEHSLAEIAPLISAKLFANLPFGGLENAILDAVPAVYIEQPLLGCEVILCGESPTYELDLLPCLSTTAPSQLPAGPSALESQPLECANLSRYLLTALSNTEGIQASLPSPTEIDKAAIDRFEAMFRSETETP
jgi:hypothetical protein